MREVNNSDTCFIEHVAHQFGKVYFNYDISDNSFRYVSPAFEKLWGIKPQDLFANSSAFMDYVHEEDTEFLSHEYQKLLATHEQTQVEFRIVQADQQIKWVCLSACIYIRSEDKQFMIGGYAEDTTKMKEYMHNIQKYNTKKNSTLEILSHDLASPFANIQSAILAIEEQVGQQDKELLQLIEFIKRDSMRGSDMIRDFVDNEFLESSQVVLNKERVDIAQKVSIMIDNYKEQSKLISKEFRLVSPEKPIFIFVDEMKFMQVMNNLVSNAIKFTKDNGIITVTVEERGNSVLISVKDNGIGIPEEMRPYLFDRFTKARRPGIRGEKSIGLGMSIIKVIVELHDGRISYESQEKVGTTFFIEIPKD